MPTRAEALFWQQVRAGRFHGYKFRRQVPIAPYIVDFLCAEARVIVELDGLPTTGLINGRTMKGETPFSGPRGSMSCAFPTI